MSKTNFEDKQDPQYKISFDEHKKRCSVYERKIKEHKDLISYLVKYLPKDECVADVVYDCVKDDMIEFTDLNEDLKFMLAQIMIEKGEHEEGCEKIIEHNCNSCNDCLGVSY